MSFSFSNVCFDLSHGSVQGKSTLPGSEVYPDYTSPGQWGGSEELQATRALLKLRSAWHKGHPLALLSGSRGTAFQAQFVLTQLEEYHSAIINPSGSYEWKGETSFVPSDAGLIDGGNTTREKLGLFFPRDVQVTTEVPTFEIRVHRAKARKRQERKYTSAEMIQGGDGGVQ